MPSGARLARSPARPRKGPPGLISTGYGLSTSAPTPRPGTAAKPDVTAPPFLAEQVALLERTPGVVRALLQDLPDSWLRERDTPNGWQSRDVLGHLISGELTDWIPRAEIIVEYGTTAIVRPIRSLRDARTRPRSAA